VKRGTKEPESADDLGSEIMTLQQVADYLHCYHQTIRKLLHTRAIHAFRLGGEWRFRRSDVDKWMDHQTATAFEIEPGNEPKKGKALKPRRKPEAKARATTLNSRRKRP
jgi:excisionase family DNA binding protein